MESSLGESGEGEMRAASVSRRVPGPSWRSLEEALQRRGTPVEASLPAVRELMLLQQTPCLGTGSVPPQKPGSVTAVEIPQPGMPKYS